MPTNLTIVLTDKPGELARIGEATGQGGIDILGLAAFTGEGRGIIHVLVATERADAARSALEQAGLGVADAREVLLIDVKDRQGSLGGLARALGEQGVNIELAYTTFGGVNLVIATDDLESAREALA